MLLGLFLSLEFSDSRSERHKENIEPFAIPKPWRLLPSDTHLMFGSAWVRLL